LSNAGGKDIPAVNSKDSWDFFDPDAPKEAANPLVLYAWDHPDRDCPEFPVVIFRHGLIGGDNLFPQSGSLHSESVEADVAASHLRSTSQDAARGTLVLTRTHDARTSPVPRSLKGVCDLQPGQGLKHEGHDPGASLTGWQVLKGELALAGTGYGCPDFLTVPEDHTLDASSGTALKVKTIPLKKVREYRAEVNTGSVRDLFAIERSLLWIFGDNDPVSDGLIKVIDTCGQSWDPGEFELPENNKETGDLVLSLLDAGVIDTIEAIRRENKLSTDDEAIALYERMKARIEQYPPLKKEPEPPTVPGFQNITKPAVIKPEK
jgi:hypothetical protein